MHKKDLPSIKRDPRAREVEAKKPKLDYFKCVGDRDFLFGRLNRVFPFRGPSFGTIPRIPEELYPAHRKESKFIVVTGEFPAFEREFFPLKGLSAFGWELFGFGLEQWQANREEHPQSGENIKVNLRLRSRKSEKHRLVPKSA